MRNLCTQSRQANIFLDDIFIEDAIQEGWGPQPGRRGQNRTWSQLRLQLTVIDVLLRWTSESEVLTSSSFSFLLFPFGLCFFLWYILFLFRGIHIITIILILREESLLMWRKLGKHWEIHEILNEYYFHWEYNTVPFYNLIVTKW